MTYELTLLRDTSLSHNSALLRYQVITEVTHGKHKDLLKSNDSELVRLGIKFVEDLYKKSKKRMYGKARLQRVRTSTGIVGK